MTLTPQFLMSLALSLARYSFAEVEDFDDLTDDEEVIFGDRDTFAAYRAAAFAPKPAEA